MISEYDIEPASVGSVRYGTKKLKFSTFPTNQNLRLSLRPPKILKKVEKSSKNKFVEMCTKCLYIFEKCQKHLSWHEKIFRNDLWAILDQMGLIHLGITMLITTLYW